MFNIAVGRARGRKVEVTSWFLQLLDRKMYGFSFITNINRTVAMYCIAGELKYNGDRSLLFSHNLRQLIGIYVVCDLTQSVCKYLH